MEALRKKEQEILYHLLNHYEKEYAYHQAVSKTLEPHKQGLDQLATLIAEASREQKMVNQERDEKRKLLVSKYTPSQSTDESEKRKSFLSSSPSVLLTSPMMDMGSPPPLSDEDKIGLGIQLENKFKGIRDLEPQDQAFKDSTGRRKEGFLFATSKPSKNHHNTPTFDMSSAVNWHKYWCVLSGGQLHEYSNWKKQLESHIEPINLRFATVREARNTDRRFCFEVITPQFRRMYQATSDEELASWITTINNAISSLLNGMGSAVDLSSSPSTKKPNGHWKHTRSFSGALSGLAAAKDKYLKKRHSSPQKPLVISLPMIIPTQEAKSDRLLTELRKDLSNTICADCSAKNPDWCSLNLGILICIECSGIHRSLGTHISKVRSLTLDSASFTADIIQLLLQIGNAKSNEIWEATLAEHGTKPVPTDTREAKLKYIQSKYMDKALVKQLDMNPMDLLYTAIEQDDIPKALYAIALGADINQPLEHTDSIPLMTKSNLQLPILDVNGNEYLDRTMQVTVLPDDRFIVRYAIHFALLTQDTQDASRVFSMAEFLFQNGADVFIVDQVNGRLLADLIGVGELVDDEAIDYLNMKNSLRGQAAILRRQTIPPPVLT
ncbi:uncharacterized protein B0P05DRAFT_563448 [Gilbertella persicaria]|uniref:uncharacterized protein n=1 Tax=Gilbertella persicaria TaxID=101096 RepID=UPI0022207C12|nr:uncharacterized protein B0P05DRAFT_563448 [Gilbertella persicaria]KAI8049803.1 hypothetical protein B0P05DRAFT_563448 [Gilbertella persicaria]